MQADTLGIRKRTINLTYDTEGLPSSLQRTMHTAQSYRASEVIFKDVQGTGVTSIVRKTDVERSMVDPLILVGFTTVATGMTPCL